MNLMIPSKIAKVGGVLISISGVVNAVLGMRIGATFYDAYPGGKMGHVGIIAGAIYIGTAGVALCYTAGVWVIVVVVMGLRRRQV